MANYELYEENEATKEAIEPTGALGVAAARAVDTLFICARPHGVGGNQLDRGVVRSDHRLHRPLENFLYVFKPALIGPDARPELARRA